MRDAETTLAIVRKRGKKGLPLEGVYRRLFNRDLYLKAYAKLYPNNGAMTKGSTEETVDGMSLEKIDTIIELLRYERYRWTPVRRTYIPKANGKKRPLGLPTWSDKLVQEVMRSILEAYYEPQFSQNSHGFRPDRGCNTVLCDIKQTWKGTIWFIEGDIAQYFDTINHDVLIEILGKKIHDGRFLNLIKRLLEAGYMEDWKYNVTYSGTPQGGVISPLLANIYLNDFDQWVEAQLIPEHTKGKRRQTNPAYREVSKLIRRAQEKGESEEVKVQIKLRRKLPSINPNDPDYRRLRYIRYADDFLLGFAGPKNEAEDIKRQIKEWLRDNLKLDMSEEKTLITHAKTQAAKFLGYEISTYHTEEKLDRHKRRQINSGISLRMPANVVEDRCTRYMKNGAPIHRKELMADSDYTIITAYQQQYRGIVQYYLMAHNVSWVQKLHWAMKTSLLKTLAAKHRTSVNKMAHRLQADIETPEGKRLKCLELRVERPDKPPLIARFGGISLQHTPWAELNDQPPPQGKVTGGRNELLQRLLAEECELCGSRDNINVHHIRKLANLNKGGRKIKPRWVQVMAARQRKTLVVCHACHVAIHNGTLNRALPK
jgi:group II intron reverse transcriptase/maturase